MGLFNIPHGIIISGRDGLHNWNYPERYGRQQVADRRCEAESGSEVPKVTVVAKGMGVKYPLAPQGVFATIQGEGLLMGVPQVFIRLAGCSVGCPGCDTNYTLAKKLDAHAIAELVRDAASPYCEWVWITGGEPAEYDLDDLLMELKWKGMKVAIATSGMAGPLPEVDFLSVSPHCHPWDPRFVVKQGDQINLVHGLNGLDLNDWTDYDLSGFGTKWVTPNSADKATVKRCVDFVNIYPGFRLGTQAHLAWGVA